MRQVIFFSLFAITLLLLTACAQLPELPRKWSAIEQQLLVRALERSLDGLDMTQLVGRRVSVHVSAMEKKEDTELVEHYVKTRLRERGVYITEDSNAAEKQVEAFAYVLGTDRHGTLVGLAEPLELALFKQDANRGRSETQLFVFDAKSGRFNSKTPISVGKSKYDNYTVLFFVDFTVEDIEVTPEGESPKDD